MENNNSRSFTVTCKVTASQKAKYQKIANEIGLPLSEFVASILEIYHEGYFGFEIPSKMEREYHEEIGALKSKIESLETDIKDLIRENERLERKMKNRLRY